MSKRVVAIKKAMILLSMGGAAFTFGFLGGGDFGGLGFGCGTNGYVTNQDLVSFYTQAGAASIDAFADSTANIIGSDFDDVVITPTANLLSNMWGNFVAQSFPLDPVAGTALRE